MYPTHEELIEFIHLLGYPNYSGGICFGLAAMAVSPVLNGSTEKTNLRLTTIKFSLDAYKNMQIACEENGESCPTLSWFLNYTLALDEKIDILAYCEGIAFHFFPSDYADCFDSDILPGRQDILLTDSIIQSIETEEKGGIAHAGTITGYYTESDIKTYIHSLDLALEDGENSASFSLIIDSRNHAIHIGYSSETKQWCYFGINTESIGYCLKTTIDEIKKLIVSEFFNEIGVDLGLVISAKIYCLNEHKERILRVKRNWQNKAFENDLFKITDKNSGLDVLGRAWIHALIIENDRMGIFYLITHEINVDIVSKTGFTALHLACHSGYKDAVEILLNAGADANRESPDGTPIIIALRYKQYEIVKLLIEKNACISAKDKDGFTALDYAILSKKADIVELILVNLNFDAIILNEILFRFFIRQQESHENYLLSSCVKKLFTAILDVQQITDENKLCVLQTYIIIRENELREKKEEYNTAYSRFFRPTGSNASAKLNSARALLNQEKNIEKRLALQFGRLGKIAAFFLNPSNSAQNHLANAEQAALTT